MSFFFFFFVSLFKLLCTIEDLKEMGIPLGPRKKIAKFVKERVSKQVRLSPGRPFVSKGFGHDELVSRCGPAQAARQAAQEKKAEVKEASQVTALPSPAETAPECPAKKLPVGNAVSSIHVNYDYFAVGTGQVNVIRGFFFVVV